MASAGCNGKYAVVCADRYLQARDLGVWHGYQDCQRFEVYSCCFSSELLRRELA
jgi:AraC family L-rhamnose operon transcriptional activator RhaR